MTDDPEDQCAGYDYVDGRNAYRDRTPFDPQRPLAWRRGWHDLRREIDPDDDAERITEETTLGELQEILAQAHASPLILLMRCQGDEIAYRSTSTREMSLADALNELLRKVGA